MLVCNILVSAQQQYSKIKIDLGQTTMRTLGSLGIETEHGEYKANYYFINWLSSDEIKTLQQNNIPFEVLVEDSKKYYATKNKASKISSGQSCYPINYASPVNYNEGSMAGFLTYDEMISELDSMATLFPNLISVRNAVGTTTTILGDTVWYVKISDNPTIKEPENELLYTGVHHAREPMGMQNLIFYMWYLIENYANDSLVKYIVDNSELYFVPCINVDGYKQNELTDPFGGGLWRKNMRDNLDGTFGVDLNRNYGFNWGFDDNGSSPFTSGNTYRGTAPFSEPETQLMRDFAINHQFNIALNYHSYGNLLIYPWGYIPDFYTPDSALFVNYGTMLTLYNNYHYGTANQTVNYVVNGSSDDWMYGEQALKNKIFAFTPETGYDFWPSQFDIDGIVKSNMYANIQTALVAGKYATLTDETNAWLDTLDGYLKFNFAMFGLDTTGTYTVTVTPLTPNISNVGAPKVYTLFQTGQTKMDSISYLLNSNTIKGEAVKYVLSVSNGLYTWNDTITKHYGFPAISFSSNGNSMNGWSSANWGTTTSHYVSAPTSITDSPFGNYNDNFDNKLLCLPAIDLTASTDATLTFFARWKIEPSFDYAVAEITDNNGLTWTPLCGKYTTTGSGNQYFNQPIYDGFQNAWVKEEISLNNYLGKNVKLRFRMVSDFGNSYDGFYIDDVEVVSNFANGINEANFIGNNISIMPNPFDDILYINTKVNIENATIELFNIQGQKVWNNVYTNVFGSIRINTKNITAGVYCLKVTDGKGFVYTLRCVKL